MSYAGWVSVPNDSMNSAPVQRNGGRRDFKQDGAELLARLHKPCYPPNHSKLRRLNIYIHTSIIIMVKLLYPLLSLASGIFAEILTTTVASSAVTATSCKTTLGSIYRKTVPTGTHTRSLGPEVDVVLAVSTRVKKVTPPAVTATQTAQVYTTTTTTAATVTGTFSTTTTLYETESETVTHTAISTLYSTEVVTSTSFVIEPTPSGWISVEKSAKIKNRQNGANFNFEQAELQHSG